MGWLAEGLISAEIPAAKGGGNKRTVDVREVVNGLMYVLSTGCQSRAIPKDLSDILPVYRNDHPLLATIVEAAAQVERHRWWPN